MNVQTSSPELAQAQSQDGDLVQFKLRMDGLKKRLSGAPSQDKQLKKACQDFEAVFISKMWQQMRSTVPKEGYLHSKDEEMYNSMFDKEFSEKMAQSGGIGLGNMMFDQLKKKLATTGRNTLSGHGAQDLGPLKGVPQASGETTGPAALPATSAESGDAAVGPVSTYEPVTLSSSTAEQGGAAASGAAPGAQDAASGSAASGGAGRTPDPTVMARFEDLSRRLRSQGAGAYRRMAASPGAAGIASGTVGTGLSAASDSGRDIAEDGR
jgi:flagellar protein FlgJ